MVQVNPLTREVLVKLVYYGPGLGGKTTSLHHVHASAPPETRGKIVSLATPVDRTLYFDFLPLRAAPVRNHKVRLQLFTVPGQVYFNATRKLVLTGADGIVFVADSQRRRHDANLESMENLASNLEDQGRSLVEIPIVLQYNKRDLPDLIEVEELQAALNALGAPAFPTCATRGEGVLDALNCLVREVLDDLESRNIFGEEPARRADVRFGRTEAGLEARIERMSEQDWRPRSSSSSSGSSDGEADPLSEGGVGTLSAPVDEAEVETQHSSSSRPPDRGVRFASLMDRHRQQAHQIELALSQSDFAAAVVGCGELVDRVCEAATKSAEAPGGSAFGALLLGVEGRTWLRFRKLVRRASRREEIRQQEALAAYALVLQLAVRMRGIL